jgi:hypothetical protein
MSDVELCFAMLLPVWRLQEEISHCAGGVRWLKLVSVHSRAYLVDLSRLCFALLLLSRLCRKRFLIALLECGG